MTRQLWRGLGLAVPWGAHTFLSMAKEKCAKESRRHGDYGKKPFIAHFGGGARYVARNGVGQLSHTGGARSCSPFSAVKMGGPFSLRCLSPLCFPAGGAGQTQTVRVGMSRRGLAGFAVFISKPVSQLIAGSRLTQPAQLGIILCSLDIFTTQKTSVISNPRWPF